MHRRMRPVAIAIMAAGLPLAWARLYLGVHFPLDMLGAFVLAMLCAAAGAHYRDAYLPLLLRAATALHGLVPAPLIQRGWVRG